MKDAQTLRGIPSVEKVLKALGPIDLPRPVILSKVRQEIARLREAETIPPFDHVLERIRRLLAATRLSRIQPVINGTGIVIHTNLGRAPLSEDVVANLVQIASGYNNLEYDLARGERGKRGSYLEECLALLCGAEAATVVNNCAAALVLILRHCASEPRNEVIISRGELVQIGGGFRIPDILSASGAKLREVGTTNKTDLADYENAMCPQTGMILRVHQSNFFMGGFVSVPAARELSELARHRGIPFVEDLGSGAVIQTERIDQVEHEPTPGEVLSQGADLVCFSGDKLFGGPQSGIIAGCAELVSKLKKEPFFRALRCEKLILSALQTTTEYYLSQSPEKQASRSGETDKNVSDGGPGIPILQMLRTPRAELQSRAQAIADTLASQAVDATVGQGQGQIGGGTLPRTNLPSVTLDLRPKKITLDELAARLRTGSPAVVGYVGEGRFRIDLRTVFPREDQLLVQALAKALAPDGLK